MVARCMRTGPGKLEANVTRPSLYRSTSAMICLLAVAAFLAGCVTAVPDVRGMSVAAATKEIQSAGLVLGPVTSVSDPSAEVGTVVKQTPSAGGSASKYSVVALQVSKGPESIRVPDVIGQAEADAVAAIEAAGLVVALDHETDKSPRGTVIAQGPAGMAVASGSTIKITISSGVDSVRVPDIGGMIDPDPALKKVGLKPKGIAIHGPIESDAAGIGEAYRQKPSAGSLVPRGTTVTYHFWWESQ